MSGSARGWRLVAIGFAAGLRPAARAARGEGAALAAVWARGGGGDPALGALLAAADAPTPLGLIEDLGRRPPCLPAGRRGPRFADRGAARAWLAARAPACRAALAALGARSEYVLSLPVPRGAAPAPASGGAAYLRARAAEARALRAREAEALELVARLAPGAQVEASRAPNRAGARLDASFLAPAAEAAILAAALRRAAPHARLIGPLPPFSFCGPLAEAGGAAPQEAAA